MKYDACTVLEFKLDIICKIFEAGLHGKQGRCVLYIRELCVIYQGAGG